MYRLLRQISFPSPNTIVSSCGTSATITVSASSTLIRTGRMTLALVMLMLYILPCFSRHSLVHVRTIIILYPLHREGVGVAVVAYLP